MEARLRSFLEPATDKQVFVIEDSTTREILGFCGLFSINQSNQCAQLKILPTKQKMTAVDLYIDTLRTVIDHAFNDLGLVRLFVNIPADDIFMTNLLGLCHAQKLKTECSYKGLSLSGDGFESYIILKDQTY